VPEPRLELSAEKRERQVVQVQRLQNDRRAVGERSRDLGNVRSASACESRLSNRPSSRRAT
jgi:hypothetical protein